MVKLKLLLPLLVLAASPAYAQQTGKQLFVQKCGVCHADPALATAPSRIGPPLKGVVGRKAAAVPTFTRYSPAMKRFGKPWDAATMSTYLAGPQKVVPGTTMAFVGVKDQAQRDAIIGYLKANP
jgi:cytochrome c